MGAWRRTAIVLAIALFVLLPLHELVDVGEQWPYDGHVVVLLLSVVFLSGLALLCRSLARACFESVRRMLRPPLAGSDPLRYSALPCPRPFLFLTLCLLRI